jgi:hypothetical protein
MMLLLSFCTYNGVPFVGIYNKTNQTLRLYALSPDFVLVIVVHHGRLTELRSGRRTTTHVSPFHRVVLQQLLDQVDMRKEHSAAAIPTQSHVVQNIPTRSVRRDRGRRQRMRASTRHRQPNNTKGRVDTPDKTPFA